MFGQGYLDQGLVFKTLLPFIMLDVFEYGGVSALHLVVHGFLSDLLPLHLAVDQRLALHLLYLYSAGYVIPR